MLIACAAHVNFRAALSRFRVLGAFDWALPLPYNWVREVVPTPASDGGHMIGKLGLPELLLILAIALLIFGPSKLADLGKGLGEGIRNFKSSVKNDENDSEKKS